MLVTIANTRAIFRQTHSAAACEKSIACSTCHVILDPESFDKLEEPSDEENVGRNYVEELLVFAKHVIPCFRLLQDMLDMAFGLEDT